jgi:tRNA(fMet)-specific endonuclease VapC
MERLSFDTTFLIDLQKEKLRGEHEVAHSFVESYRQHEYCLSMIALGEFVAGFADPHVPECIDFVRQFKLLAQDELTAFHYGRLFREMKSRGHLIGANDLWIASSALRAGLPLVTRNVAKFSRVPRLQVIGY